MTTDLTIHFDDDEDAEERWQDSPEHAELKRRGYDFETLSGGGLYDGVLRYWSINEEGLASDMFHASMPYAACYAGDGLIGDAPSFMFFSDVWQALLYLRLWHEEDDPRGDSDAMMELLRWALETLPADGVDLDVSQLSAAGDWMRVLEWAGRFEDADPLHFIAYMPDDAPHLWPGIEGTLPDAVGWPEEARYMAGEVAYYFPTEATPEAQRARAEALVVEVGGGEVVWFDEESRWAYRREGMSVHELVTRMRRSAEQV